MDDDSYPGLNSAPTETGLVIPVPEMEKLVRTWRPTAVELWEIPAHITVLYPWVPPPVPAASLERLTALLETVGPFDFELTDVAWFGEDVVYVTPHPPEVFSELTQRIWDEWPQHPPYGGAHPEPIPHLTIGDSGPLDAMHRAADAARALLPITCRAEELWVMEGRPDPGAWSIAQRLPFRD